LQESIIFVSGCLFRRNWRDEEAGVSLVEHLPEQVELPEATGNVDLANTVAPLDYVLKVLVGALPSHFQASDIYFHFSIIYLDRGYKDFIFASPAFGVLAIV